MRLRVWRLGEAGQRRRSGGSALRSLSQRGFHDRGGVQGPKRLIRGSLSMQVEPAQLHDPALPGHLWLQSSGSRGTQTSVAFDLGYLRDRAVDTRMVLDVCGGGGWRHALWNVPGGSSLFTLLHFSLCGSPFVHWMSPVDAAAAGLHPRYRWSARLLRLGGGLGGSRFPRALLCSGR